MYTTLLIIEDTALGVIHPVLEWEGQMKGSEKATHFFGNHEGKIVTVPFRLTGMKYVEIKRKGMHSEDSSPAWEWEWKKPEAE